MPNYTKDENRNWHNSLPSKRVAANVLIWNERKELLIGKPNYRDHWLLPGGVVDEGESPIAGAIREAKEEFDLDITPDDLKLKVVAHSAEADGFKDFMAFLFDGITLTPEQVVAIKLQEDEFDEYKFAPINEVVQLLSDMMAKRLMAATKASEVVFLEA